MNEFVWYVTIADWSSLSKIYYNLVYNLVLNSSSIDLSLVLKPYMFEVQLNNEIEKNFYTFVTAGVDFVHSWDVL